MASCAMFFIIRRYGIGSWGKKWLALGLLFITLSTMYARFMLDTHDFRHASGHAFVPLPSSRPALGDRHLANLNKILLFATRHAFERDLALLHLLLANDRHVGMPFIIGIA